MNNIIIKRIWILLFLLISHSVTHAATILSQGARNVKNGAAYGGASAVGDGVHDDTQAFLDAFNLGGFGQRAIYVPPGTYLLHTTLIVWDQMFFFGEPSSPPTLVLKSGSMTSGSAPFICPVASYNHNPYDTNWDSANNSPPYASANNTFSIDIRDINFTVQPNNPGCSDVMLWRVAQQSSFRNSVLTSYSGMRDTFHTGLFAGGNAIVNITMSGNATSWNSDGSGELFFRNCTFNGAVNAANVNALDFVACTFNDPTGSGFNYNGVVLGLYDCVFTSGTPFNPNNTWHIENTRGVKQQTSNTNGLFYNGTQESSSSANLSTTGVVRGSPYPNPAFPYPTTACVNVKSYGAKGDGSTNDTAAINAALANANEVFFPIGNYYVGNSTITVAAGKKLWGIGDTGVVIQGTGNPTLNMLGAGSGLQSVLANIWVQRVNGATGGHILELNCDSSSLIMDCQVDPQNTLVDEGTLIPTGGVFIENGAWEGNPANVGGTVVTSPTGPCTFYAWTPEHWWRPAMVFNGANNCTVINCEIEGDSRATGNAAITITNSNNITLHGMFLGGVTTPYGVTVSNSQVNIGPIMQLGSNFQGLINENGTNYGTTSLDGYINSNVSPIQL
jgi:hypothetical protein